MTGRNSHLHSMQFSAKTVCVPWPSCNSFPSQETNLKCSKCIIKLIKEKVKVFGAEKGVAQLVFGGLLKKRADNSSLG